MNLLPKNDVDFAKREYWNKFFKERGAKGFEWYGEYEELCRELHKYLKKEDSILVIGCGNSMLSCDLFDIGFRQITNIDISSIAVKQMRNKVGKSRPELVFEEMDVLNMKYENEKFSVVLDKGTLDALMPTDSEEDKKRAEKLFSEVERVLKNNGRYIIISLLQDHVVRQILSQFSEKGWMVRITRCWDVENKIIKETGSLAIPVFMVVCIKFKKMLITQPILELNIFVNGKPLRVPTVEEALQMIEGVQRYVFNFREARGEMEITFCKNGKEDPRYSIYIVDKSQDQRQLLSYAAFIVPHGRESEWMFGTIEGRRYLRKSSGYDRLAVVTFYRNQDYGAMDEIQDELRQTILQLAPCFLPALGDTPKIPFLTLGDGVGRRKTIYTTRSEFSGELVVEEVEIEKETFRRLVFMNNQAVVQSEVKLKDFQKGKKDIDWSHIASSHILYLSIPGAMIREEKSIGVVGLGGGSLCIFLRKVFPSAYITGIDIDPVVVEVAGKYFGFKADDHLKVIIEDGIEFLKRKPKLDVLLLDVDSKERGSAISCPPPQFLEPPVLECISDILGTQGVFAMNVVSRVEEEFKKVKQKIEKYFGLVSTCSLKEDVNRIVFASNWKNLSKSDWQKRLKNAAENLEKVARQKLNAKSSLLDLNHLIQQLRVYKLPFPYFLNLIFLNPRKYDRGDAVTATGVKV